MPEKIWRLPSSPASSSKRSSLSEPSTNSQATTLPMRRSSLAKSAMPMMPGASGSCLAGAAFFPSFAFTAAAAGAGPARVSRLASTMASTCLGSRRVNSGS